MDDFWVLPRLFAAAVVADSSFYTGGGSSDETVAGALAAENETAREGSRAVRCFF